MEKCYQKEKLKENYMKSRSPLYYKTDLNQEDKENLFKEIYSNIDQFYRLLYESKR